MLKDHHSIKVFPNDKPYYINVVFGAASGVAALVFGKIGDHTVFFFFLISTN